MPDAIVRDIREQFRVLAIENQQLALLKDIPGASLAEEMISS